MYINQKASQSERILVTEAVDGVRDDTMAIVPWEAPNVDDEPSTVIQQLDALMNDEDIYIS